MHNFKDFELLINIKLWIILVWQFNTNPRQLSLTNKGNFQNHSKIILLQSLQFISVAIQYQDTTDYYWPLISEDNPTSFVTSNGKTTYKTHFCSMFFDAIFTFISHQWKLHSIDHPNMKLYYLSGNKETFIWWLRLTCSFNYIILFGFGKDKKNPESFDCLHFLTSFFLIFDLERKKSHFIYV